MQNPVLKLEKKMKMPRQTVNCVWSPHWRGVHVAEWGWLLNHFPKFSNAAFFFFLNKPLGAVSQRSWYFSACALRKACHRPAEQANGKGVAPSQRTLTKSWEVAEAMDLSLFLGLSAGDGVC